MFIWDIVSRKLGGFRSFWHSAVFDGASLLLATYLVACDQRCSTVGNTKEVSGILLVLHRLFDFGWAGAPLRSDDWRTVRAQKQTQQFYWMHSSRSTLHNPHIHLTATALFESFNQEILAQTWLSPWDASPVERSLEISGKLTWVFCRLTLLRGKFHAEHLLSSSDWHLLYDC